MTVFPAIFSKKPTALAILFSLVLLAISIPFSAYKTETQTAQVTKAVKVKFLRDLENLEM